MVLEGLGKEASSAKPRQAFLFFRNGDLEVTTESGAMLKSCNLRKLRAMATGQKLKPAREGTGRGDHFKALFSLTL